jgi:hypothetical protein
MEIEMDQESGIAIIDWRPLERGTLLGFCRVKIERWHLTIDGIAIHARDGRRWAQLPSKPMLNSNRELEREPDGKPRYAKILWFDDRETADRFSAAVVSAVDRFVGASERVDGGVF